jgi:hypothetical protein
LTPRRTLLLLGGGGMVGQQVALEAARELRLDRIVICAATQREVDGAIAALKGRVGDVELEGFAGDILIPTALRGTTPDERIANREHFDRLFNDIFSQGSEGFEESELYHLIEKYQPDYIVDSIPTASAIAYLDVFTTSQRVKLMLDAVDGRDSVPGSELQPLIKAVRELLITQGIPQLTRHVLYLHRALEKSSVRVYVKVGTTGTGGMGLNIPYTHSEDKPSATLISKSAIGFAHTGLLFLLARTPGESIIKEVKPGAMIGFKSLGVQQVRVKRQPAFLIESREEVIGEKLQTIESGYAEDRETPINIVGADTGENGFFSVGEFQAITYPRQMEAVTPEEVARTVILEILGASTGRDVLSAIDGAITEPSYRAGVLRDHAVREMQRLEKLLGDEVLPSIAVGQLGPPMLSKLLVEAFLLREALGDDIATMLRSSAAEMQQRVEQYLAQHPRVVSMVTTIGIPFLRESPLRLTRGPRVNIPPTPADGSPVPLGDDRVEAYARTGWVDLRVRNFERWRERLEQLQVARPDIAAEGSAAFALKQYLGDRFVPGDVVGWLFTIEGDHRLY